MADGQQLSKPGQKRKAESQDNERLSKRLGQLNLEQNGSKLYVPVETPAVNGSQPVTLHTSQPHAQSLQNGANTRPPAESEDSMRLDDSKHKVYIYNIDDELSSDSEVDEEGKLIFLPDIQKHLNQNRIPPRVLANSDQELAGMQLVLYSDPSSISVPSDKDGVRKAIIESRRRFRQGFEQSKSTSGSGADVSIDPAPSEGSAVDDDTMDMD